MTLLRCVASACLLSGALVLPAGAYDLQYRQNGINFSASQLRSIVSSALPADYDRRFPEQRWTTYLLLDAHANKGLVAITVGLSPRVGAVQALLPVATFSVIEPLPSSTGQWQQLLGTVVQQYGRQMIDHRDRIIAR